MVITYGPGKVMTFANGLPRLSNKRVKEIIDLYIKVDLDQFSTEKIDTDSADPILYKLRDMILG